VFFFSLTLRNHNSEGLSWNSENWYKCKQPFKVSLGSFLRSFPTENPSLSHVIEIGPKNVVPPP